MFRSRWLAVCTATFAVVALAAPAKASLYTFDSLTADANLIGQDNWIHGSTGATSATNWKVRTGTGINTSNVVIADNGDAQAVRKNDANFSIPTFTGTEKIYYQFDAQYGQQQQSYGLFNVTPSPYAINVQAPIFGFAKDFRLPANPIIMNFNFRIFGPGATTVLPPISQVFIPVADTAPEIQLGDWVKLRLELDLTGYGGNGSASMFYKDLTLGQTDFTPVPGIQNMNSNLMSFPAATRYLWDTMYIRGGISADNPMDNLEVGLIRAGVPEPGSILLLAIGGIGLAVYRGRRR